MKWRMKECIAAAVLLAMLIAFFFLSAAIFLPERYDYGATWSMFEAEDENSIDVMFFGSSFAYCDIVPAILWEDLGCSAYVMAGPRQTLPITYYYLREVYRTQTPCMIFVEVTGAFFPQYTDYTRVNIGYMPWSVNRLAATIYAAERSEQLGLLFPLYNYHDRWDELEKSDYDKALYGSAPDPLAGYTFLSESEDVTNDIQEREIECDLDNYEKNVQYLQKIAALGQKKGSQVIFYLSPSYLRYNAQYSAMLAKDIGAIDGAVFLDFNDSFDALQIDDSVDFYDHGHFNYRGAEKFTHAVAQVIDAAGVSLPDRKDSALWQERLDFFHDKVASVQ